MIDLCCNNCNKHYDINEIIRFDNGCVCGGTINLIIPDNDDGAFMVGVINDFFNDFKKS